MPQAVALVVEFAKAYPAIAKAIAVTAASVAVNVTAASIQKNKLKDEAKKSRNRVDVLLRSATEPQRIIYGTRRVSGVLAYANVRLSTGTNDNSDLWQVIALAGHEIDGITDLYLDGDKIPASSIDGSGEVTSGKYGPISGRSPVQMLTNLGSESQTALSIGFADWSSAHRLRGIAHIATRFELSTRGSANLWRNGAPSNVRVTVRGKKVYDPRLDSTQSGGSGSHRVTDSTTWEYSSNPALCLADYLIDERLGMGQEGVTAGDIDYAMVATAADQCDATVSVPGGTEPRYSINGVLFASEKYETNIRDILQTMNGQMTWSNGQFRIRAGEYAAPVLSFDEDDIIGGIGISAERGRETRINKIRGTFANAAEDYDQTQYLPVEDANLIANRDAGITLAETVDQPMVTSEYQAQRLAHKLISIGNQQMRATIPLNYRAMNVTVGDRIQVSVDSLSWSNKVFRVEGWSFAEDGFELDVIEDSSTAYDDPAVGDYSVRSASGSITFADPPVPSPSGLTATAERNGILVQWDEPEPPSLFDEVQVFASADSSWSNATRIASTRGTAFFHDLDPGTQRYYWVRSIDSVDEVSDRDPDSDTSSVQATAGAVGAADVDDISSASSALFNPSFELGDTGWTKGTGWSIISTAQARRGSRAAYFSGAVLSSLKSETSPIPVSPGDKVLAYLYAKIASGPGTLRVRVAWLNSSGAEFNYTLGPAFTASSYQQSRSVATAPAGTAYAEIHALADGTAGATTGYVDDCYLSALSQDSEIDALLTQNAPAEAGAQVNGAGSLALVINRQLDDTSQPGEACLLGIVDGEPDFDTNGAINWNGSRITVDRAQRGSTANGVSLLTGAARSVGQIAFDTAKGKPFTVQGTAVDVAFVRRTTSGWQYDNNTSWVSFTPDADMVSLGVMDAGGDVIYSGSLWGQPILLTDAPEARSDVTGDHAADIDVLDTQNAPAEARATRGLVDLVVAETDGAITNNSTTTYTEAQSLELTLSETTVVLITMSGLISRVGSSSQTFSQVRALKDGAEIGGLSSYVTLVPGGTGSANGYLPWTYRRVETLAAGTYEYSFEFRQVVGSVTTRFTNRVITAEEVG